MKIECKNKPLERCLIAVNLVTAAMAATTFIMLYGFTEPLMKVRLLHLIQISAFLIFLAEKAIRFVNAVSKKQFFRANWFEVPLLILVCVMVFGSATGTTKMLALAIYLVFQVVIKACRSCVNLAASGRNPTRTLFIIFLVLILTGAGLLTLPKARTCEEMSFIDALFTATSATCVTGLVVKDTGGDFSTMGQIIILTLIQLGGLGIVIFGAILALLLGQALNVRESVAMQDLLSTQTLGRIGHMIGFIFISTLIIETIGALTLFDMFNAAAVDRPGLCAVFHSISAFCNAGFSLFNASLIDYRNNWQVPFVIAPLIILGGLGFGVLNNIFNILINKITRFFKRSKYTLTPSMMLQETVPVKVRLQTKIVLTMSLMLIIVGALGIMIFGNNPAESPLENFNIAMFQSITARTAGFNTVDVASMSPASRLILIILMFIGGSPASTAGGIKTITLAVLIMTVYATLHKKRDVEIFQRSVRPVVVGRAITVIMLFIAVLATSILLLSATEAQNNFDMEDIAFEAASALGTVGLSTGITPSLTTLGKLIIMVTMLIGRLGPLTLLASLTFNIKPAGYSYPEEPVIVG